jgi:hypothetical protein
MKGVLSWLVRWACRAGTRDFCSALAVLVGQVQNIFFLAIHDLNSFVPIPQQVGQATVLGHLSVSMDLWSPLAKKTGHKKTTCSGILSMFS